MPTYHTIDNGGKSYKIVKSQGDNISIYSPNDKLVVKRKIKKVISGAKSSTFLAELSKNRYLYVGSMQVYEFNTDSPVKTFKSPLGNSGVPYPYAITDKHVYLLAENACVSLDESGKKNPYNFYYSLSKKEQKKGKIKVKTLHHVLRGNGNKKSKRSGRKGKGKSRKGKGKSRKGKSRKGRKGKSKSRKGKSKKGKSRKGKSRKGKSRKGRKGKSKSRKGKSRKGKSKKGKSRKGRKGRRRKPGRPKGSRNKRI